MATLDYSKTDVPDDYVCGGCGVRGVRLWRTGSLPVELRCAACATRAESACRGKAWRSDWARGEGDQIGEYLPCEPTPENDGYWGYSSVPDKAIAWWYRLPTRLTGGAREEAALKHEAERLALKDHRSNHMPRAALRHQAAALRDHHVQKAGTLDQMAYCRLCGAGSRDTSPCPGDYAIDATDPESVEGWSFLLRAYEARAHHEPSLREDYAERAQRIRAKLGLA